MRWLLGASIICLVLALSAPANAAVSIAINSGTLTFPNAAITAAAFNVNANGSISWRVDGRGTTAGWNVTLQVSNFTATGGKTISASALSYTATNGTINKVAGGSSQDIDPVNGPKETGLSGTLDVARKCLTTNANFGDGRYDWVADPTQFVLTVPATALVGAYTATVTATAISGP